MRMAAPNAPNARHHAASIQHLKLADPILAAVIERVGDCTLEPRREGTHFDALLRAIVYQQLSGKAAATIHSRVVDLYGRAPAPRDLIATPDESLRAAGLSRQKLSYIKDLAAKVESGAVPLDESEVDRLSDDEIIERLVQVKGIGRWTVHMFLIFRLGRPDVLPELDLGVQNAIKRAYRLRKQPKPNDVRRIGAKWSPYASIASWYLWRSLETPAAQQAAGRKVKKKKKTTTTARAGRKRRPSTGAVKKRRR
jgi:3-methyladenine DNA glycosylase/8-oxoguanine DNA glycosylase